MISFAFFLILSLVFCFSFCTIVTRTAKLLRGAKRRVRPEIARRGVIQKDTEQFTHPLLHCQWLPEFGPLAGEKLNSEGCFEGSWVEEKFLEGF